MASLFDFFNGSATPEQNAGLLGFASQILGASNGRQPVNFGQALAAGAQGFQQGRQQHQDREQAQAQLQQLVAMRDLQMRSMQGDLDAQEAARRQAAALAEFNQQYHARGQSAGAPPPLQAESLPKLGAQPQASFPGQPQPQAQNSAPQGGLGAIFTERMQYAQAARAAGHEGAAKAALEEALKFMPEVKEYQNVYGQDGKVYRKPYFKDGSSGALIPAEVAEKLTEVNTGGAVDLVNPFTGASIRKLTKTMTPGEVENSRIARANLGISQQRLALDRQNAGRPVYNAEAGGFVLPPSAANPGGKLIPLSGVSGGKLTEDQGKATSWVVQAENAYNNMRKVAFDASGKLTSAARPGAADALAGVPFLGAVGNTLRSADRQKFVQASSSLSEALLRAATGAGVNRDEAAQKVAEITPQFGDSEEVVQQKFAAVPLYLDSLKVRAGPGAKRAEGVLSSNAAPAAGGVKFLGFEN